MAVCRVVTGSQGGKSVVVSDGIVAGVGWEVHGAEATPVWDAEAPVQFPSRGGHPGFLIETLVSSATYVAPSASPDIFVKLIRSEFEWMNATAAGMRS